MSKNTEKVREIAEPIVKSQGLELVDVEYVKEGSNWILRVFIENNEGELNIDHCENISKILSKELDLIDPIKNSYILEVSSPGIERPLKTTEDYKRFKGELVKIKTYVPLNGEKEFVGNLQCIDDDIVKIKLKEQKGVVGIPLSKVASANLTIDF